MGGPGSIDRYDDRTSTTVEAFSVGPAAATYRVGVHAQRQELPGGLGLNQPADASS